VTATLDLFQLPLHDGQDVRRREDPYYPEITPRSL